MHLSPKQHQLMYVVVCIHVCIENDGHGSAVAFALLPGTLELRQYIRSRTFVLAWPEGKISVFQCNTLIDVCGFDGSHK